MSDRLRAKRVIGIERNPHGPTAEWRALRLVDVLARTSPGSTPRRDAVREALEAVSAEVESLARENTTPAGAAGLSGGGFQVAAHFIRAVDEVLGVVVPLLRSEDEGLEDAQASLLRWLDVDAYPSRAIIFMQAVASVTIHVLASVAWRLQREATLGWCIKHLAGRYRSLIYLKAFDGRSDHSTRAVEQALRESAVVSRLVPEVRDSFRGPRGAEESQEPEEPPASLLCVEGLIAMRAVWFGPVAEISSQLQPGGEPPMLDWPAFQREYNAWVEVVPEQFLHSPRWERETARRALDVGDAHDLRRYWAKNGKVLTRLLAAAYSHRRLDGSGWGREYPSPAWRRWVETA